MHLFDLPTLLAYLAAATVLVLLPGPGTAWIVAQSLAGGTARGLRAALGLETATLLHALAAGLGLSAVLAASALAYDALKYAGAAYLVWLGLRAWFARTDAGADLPGALLSHCLGGNTEGCEGKDCCCLFHFLFPYHECG